MSHVADPTQSRIDAAIDRLVNEFDGQFKQETIRRLAGDSVRVYAGARVTEFVPLLFYRSARERLKTLLQTRKLDGPLTLP